MSSVAILIGFNYENNNNSIDTKINPNDDIKKLPGIIIDLYQAYINVSKMKPDKILVITDITNDESFSNLFKSMIDGVVSAGVITFINEIKDQNQHYMFTGYDNLISMINDSIKSSTKVFFYYTGHLNNNNIILPIYIPNVTFINNEPTFIFNDELNINKVNTKVNNKLKDKLKDKESDKLFERRNLNLTVLRKLFATATDPNAEIILVMDCCHHNGMGLPFSLKNGIFRMTGDDNKVYMKQKILCFTSTIVNEKSVISNKGSIFTKAFFRQISMGVKSIRKILENVTEEVFDTIPSKTNKQTPTVYSTYPDIRKVWPWLYGSNFNVNLDIINNVIIINK
jgi:hypothetical protein